MGLGVEVGFRSHSLLFLPAVGRLQEGEVLHQLRLDLQSPMFVLRYQPYLRQRQLHWRVHLPVRRWWV